MLLRTKYAEISNGITLPYVERGNIDGLPVIFLHGMSDSLHSFDLLLPRLPDSIRAFAVTQRGHGDAAKPESFSPDDFAGDIAKFMDAVGIDSAVIVGHSLGSFNAQRLAINYPEKVSGLVLIGSFSTCKDNEDVIGFYEEVISLLKDPVSEEFVREFQASTISKPVPAEFFETVVSESLKMPARVWQAVSEGIIENDNSDDLGKIEVPTILLWGEGDAYFRRPEQDKLVGLIKDAELIVYPEVGHSPQWEWPEMVAFDLLDFIENSVVGKRTAAKVTV
jgi:non-heme chloroperoxidase